MRRKLILSRRTRRVKNQVLLIDTGVELPIGK